MTETKPVCDVTCEVKLGRSYKNSHHDAHEYIMITHYCDFNDFDIFGTQ